MAEKETIKNGVTEYKDAAGDWRFRVTHSGRIIAASTEGYRNRKDMWQAAMTASLLILEYMRAQENL